MIKKLFTALAILISLASKGQVYDPSNAARLLTINKPLGFNGYSPDARSRKFDSTIGAYRNYNNPAEVLSTLVTAQSRTGWIPIYVGTGEAMREYWFKGCTNDTCLKIRPDIRDSTSVPIDSTLKVTSGVLGVNSGKLPGGGVLDTVIYKVTKNFGALGDGVTDDRVAIQAAIDMASASGGGTVMLDKAGATYITGTVLASGITRGLTMKPNVTLLIPPGVTLKLKSNSVTNSVPVQVIHIPTASTNVYVGWRGAKGGIIDGNTTNQPGYTLGYTQTNGNYLIGAANAFNGVTIENMTLIRCFSNTINLGGSNTYGNSQNATIRGVRSEVFGEGPQIIGTDNVTVENCLSLMDGTIVQGDAIELSFCRYFTVAHQVSRTTTGASISQGGSGIDLYASRYGNVTDMEIIGTQYGMQVETDFTNTSNNPDWITISGGTIRLANFASFIFTGGHITVSNVYAVDNVFTGSQLGKFTVNAAEFTFNNVYFSGACQMIATSDNIVINGEQLSFVGNGVGIPLSPLSIGSSTLNIDGLYAYGSISNSVIILAQNSTPHGKVINVDAAGFIPMQAGGEFAINPRDLYIEGNPPFSTTNGAVSSIVGMQKALTSAEINSTSLPIGTRDQVIEINGIYNVKLRPGARLRLFNNPDSLVLNGASEFVTLKFNAADSSWAQIAGIVREVEPDWKLSAPNLMTKSIGSFNDVQSNNTFRFGIRFWGQEQSTRPSLGGGLREGEFRGVQWGDDNSLSGFARIRAGGDSAHASWIDLTALNGTLDVEETIEMGVHGTRKLWMNKDTMKVYVPVVAPLFTFSIPRTLRPLDVVYKQHLDTLLAGIVASGLPSQTGNAGKSLITNGTTASWSNTLTASHLLGTGTAPTIAGGSAAGTSPTVTISGTDLSGEITTLTGTTPAANTTIATITFNSAYASTPYPVISPSNGNAANAVGVYVVRVSATQFQIAVTSAALTAATTYKWTYQISQ